MYGNCHPGLFVWQHPPICSANHTTGCYGSIPRHSCSSFSLRINIGKLSDFIFYWTGLTGFTGYFISAHWAELSFATFFWKVAKKRNPVNPVNPV
jgi:hypothetical protein